MKWRGKRVRVFEMDGGCFASMLIEGNETHIKCIEGVPKNAEFRGYQYSMQKDTHEFLFEHESFEEVEDHMCIPRIRAEFRNVGEEEEDGESICGLSASAPCPDAFPNGCRDCPHYKGII